MVCAQLHIIHVRADDAFLNGASHYDGGDGDGACDRGGSSVPGYRDDAYVSPSSPLPGTPSWGLPPHVPW